METSEMYTPALYIVFAYYNKKHLKNVGPIRHCEPPHAPFTTCRYCRTPALSHAGASMSTTTTTTTTTTTRDRGDRYGPMEWAQLENPHWRSHRLTKYKEFDKQLSRATALGTARAWNWHSVVTVRIFGTSRNCFYQLYFHFSRFHFLINDLHS